MHMISVTTLIFLSILVTNSLAFKIWRGLSIETKSNLHLIQNNEVMNENVNRGRSSSIVPFKVLVTLAAITVINIFDAPMSVLAAQDVPSPRIYKSGKNPDGVSSKESTAGTKKDTSFLRCMSNCKTQCQLPGEGLVKSDCVQDCQDQCCNSYEQCSFKIKINTGNAI